MKPGSFGQQMIYRIKIRQLLDHPLAEFIVPVSIEPLADGGTLLRGSFADQSALRGFLNQLWDLNFTVLLVEQMENRERRPT